MLKISLLSIIILIVSGCSTIQVTSEYNPKRDFSSLKTYAWLNDMDHPSDNLRINNELVIRSVRNAVEESLESKGFVKTTRDQADFLISWFGAIEQKVKAETITHFYAPYGYGTLYRDPAWNTQAQAIALKEYEKGSLIFDFLDPKSNTLIWRGIGQDRITEGQSGEKIKKNLHLAVSQILADFPPKIK